MPKNNYSNKRIAVILSAIILLILFSIGFAKILPNLKTGADASKMTGASFYLEYPSSEKNNIKLTIELKSGSSVKTSWTGTLASLTNQALENISSGRSTLPISKLYIEDANNLTNGIKITINSPHQFTSASYKVPDGLSTGNRGNYFTGTDAFKKEFYLQFNKPFSLSQPMRQINIGQLSLEAIPSQPASIQGTVKINGTDHRLLNAQLFLLQNDQKIADTTSGADGSYTFNNLKSGSNFAVGGNDIGCGGAGSSNPIYMNYSFTISQVNQINLNPGSNTVDLVANKALCRGAVSGKFIDTQFNPIDNVRVEAYSSSSGSSRRSEAQVGKTDYIFNDLTPGAWMISATRNGVNGDDYRDNDSDKSYTINITDSNTFFEFKDFKF